LNFFDEKISVMRYRIAIPFLQPSPKLITLILIFIY
jgi:hypothetical protein